MLQAFRLPRISFCWRSTQRLVLAAIALSGISGCSLGVMAGKALLGDLKQPSEFRTRTGIDLAKSGKSLLVVVQTPQAIGHDLPELNAELSEAMNRRLKLHGIDVVDPDRVSQWIDQNGGRFDHPTELAQAFDADFIAVIDVESFRISDPASPQLYQGLASGQVQIFEVHNVAESQQAQSVFGASFRNQYPPHGPVPMDQTSPRLFQKRFIDHLSDRLGSRFYDYRLADEM